MHLEYNTNGFAHHRLLGAIEVLAELGYAGIALTPDVAHLDLRSTGPEQWGSVRAELDRRNLRCSVETGARYVLDDRIKHWPNLVSESDADADRRVAYYRKCFELAGALGSPVASIWSGGCEPEVSRERGMQLLISRLPGVLDLAAEGGVAVCLEPEPGMLVESLGDFRELVEAVGRDDLYLTLDVGHLIVTEPGDPHEHVGGFGSRLRHVQIDDARRGVHEHLPIGAGEIDFAKVIAALQDAGYDGALAVELSRDSHRAVDAARDAYQSLAPLIEQ